MTSQPHESYFDLAFWECGHVEIDQGKTHACDGRVVCSSTTRRVVLADRADELQAAVDRAHAAMVGSQYVGGPTERDAWRTALGALERVVTQHLGQAEAE